MKGTGYRTASTPFIAEQSLKQGSAPAGVVLASRQESGRDNHGRTPSPRRNCVHDTSDSARQGSSQGTGLNQRAPFPVKCATYPTNRNHGRADYRLGRLKAQDLRLISRPGTRRLQWKEVFRPSGDGARGADARCSVRSLSELIDRPPTSMSSCWVNLGAGMNADKSEFPSRVSLGT